MARVRLQRFHLMEIKRFRIFLLFVKIIISFTIELEKILKTTIPRNAKRLNYKFNIQEIKCTTSEFRYENFFYINYVPVKKSVIKIIINNIKMQKKNTSIYNTITIGSTSFKFNRPL